MRPEIELRWVDYFRSNGYPAAVGIAAGMEGAVYSLEPGQLVAKVWVRRGATELRALKSFYDALRPFCREIVTPEIVEVRHIEGALVSIERFLSGSPLQERLAESAEHADQSAALATARVLAFLATVPPLPPFSQLAVLDEAVPPWQGATKWSEAMGSLLRRRVARFGHQLAREIPDLDRVVARVEDFVRTRDAVPMRLIHGDLCGVNIMVDDALRPTAVFDFGFLSTVGDPAFDASVSSAIFNMYGPHARQIDDEVTGIFSRELGQPREVLLAYRALYGLLTSNAYSPEGTDGHYRWCVESLRREDVRQSLGL